MLQRVGLADVKGVQLRKFSKGMLQRAGIAQAILHDPKLVFFDEPMSGLDPLGRREVRDLMEQLKQRRQDGIFLDSHSLRRRSTVRSRRHHSQRRIARSGSGGRLDLDAFKAKWKSSGKAHRFRRR